jgi:PKD repeat protein
VVAWSWNFGAGSSSQDSSEQNPTHVYALPGSYAVTLAVTDAYGQSSTTHQTVTVS